VLRSSFVLDPAFRIGAVRRRMFGALAEHMGRSIYTGIYEPGHPTADENGFRQDVLDLVRELGVTLVRYPGGNFVSGYRWEDGVGPVAQRPQRLDLAWHSMEPNQFGLGEFMTWCELADVEPMLAVNLGLRGAQEAVDLLEYANHPGGTTLADLRRAHGADAPYDVRLWCLGNEMDGPWQLGHKTAAEYGRLARETARAMRKFDPALELVVCGSSTPNMSTFGAWEVEVLAEAYDEVDLISCHSYFEERRGDLRSFLASSVAFESMINSVLASADTVRARKRGRKRLDLSVDEWNVAYLSRPEAKGPTDGWPVGPRISEDRYHVADAVVVGSLLITLLRHADRVGAACLAQLVNVIAPIRSEPDGPAWRQTIFHPFAATAANARGEVLRVEVVAPTMETNTYGPVPAVDAVATYDDEHETTAVFLVNRAVRQQAQVVIDARALAPPRVVECVTLTAPDVRVVNDATAPDRVRLQDNSQAAVDGGRVSVVLPPVSWTMLRLAPAG
jgi:alpha-N-arabinofuranosidase